VSDDVGAKRQRVSEEDYFRKKDRELIERMREAAAADQARRELGAKTGLTDPALLGALQELGFTPATVALLPLVPVVQMAWAEGGVTPVERAMVVDLARKRGIEAGNDADRQLSDWLTLRPSQDVFDGAMRLISAMLATASGSHGGVNADDVIQSAEAIASASGGILGIGKVSAEERALLAQIQTSLRDKKG
jgi:hypothetical protein